MKVVNIRSHKDVKQDLSKVLIKRHCTLSKLSGWLEQLPVACLQSPQRTQRAAPADDSRLDPALLKMYFQIMLTVASLSNFWNHEIPLLLTRVKSIMVSGSVIRMVYPTDYEQSTEWQIFSIVQGPQRLLKDSAPSHDFKGLHQSCANDCTVISVSPASRKHNVFSYAIFKGFCLFVLMKCLDWL